MKARGPNLRLVPHMGDGDLRACSLTVASMKRKLESGNGSRVQNPSLQNWDAGIPPSVLTAPNICSLLCGILRDSRSSHMWLWLFFIRTKDINNIGLQGQWEEYLKTGFEKWYWGQVSAVQPCLQEHSWKSQHTKIVPKSDAQSDRTPAIAVTTRKGSQDPGRRSSNKFPLSPPLPPC